MNTNFSDAKEHFIKHGYCQFSLKDFDVNFYNILDKFLSCDGDDNLKEMFYTFRFDAFNKNTRYMSPIRSFDDAKQNALELLNECEDHSKISQLWYFQNDLDYVQSFVENKKPDFKNFKIKDEIVKTTNDILKYFYEDISNDIIHDELQLSFYDVDNVFTPHSDGMTVNLCSILIYLNKNYDKNNGGLLLLNGEEVIPELGMVALMDLSKHDVNHGVTKVVSEPGRYAIFNFPKLKS